MQWHYLTILVCGNASVYLDKRPVCTGKIFTFFLPNDCKKIKVLLIVSVRFFMCFACPIPNFQLKQLMYCTTYACPFSFTSSLQNIFSYWLKIRAQVEISFTAITSFSSVSLRTTHKEGSSWRHTTVPPLSWCWRHCCFLPVLAVCTDSHQVSGQWLQFIFAFNPKLPWANIKGDMHAVAAFFQRAWPHLFGMIYS